MTLWVAKSKLVASTISDVFQALALLLTTRQIDLDLLLWSIQCRQSQAVAMRSKATMVTPAVMYNKKLHLRCICKTLYFQQKYVSGQVRHLLSLATLMIVTHRIYAYASCFDKTEPNLPQALKLSLYCLSLLCSLNPKPSQCTLPIIKPYTVRSSPIPA